MILSNGTEISVEDLEKRYLDSIHTMLIKELEEMIDNKLTTYAELNDEVLRFRKSYIKYDS